LRYEPQPDQNVELQERIVALAQRHRRYGADMIYLRLRQTGLRVNHKRSNASMRWRSCRFAGGAARKFRLPSVNHCAD
jgi:hypothetical protein